MEALLIIAIIVLAGIIVFGVYFFTLLMSALTTHRQAMHALHQELAARRVPRS
jgi:hypothetical protein